MIWLAAGSLNNLNVEKCSALNGRDVTFYPDLNGYEKWQAKVHELAKLAKFAKYKVSTILEDNSSVAEKIRGFDLADYLVRFNYLDFIDTP